MRIYLPINREGKAARPPGLVYDCDLASRIKRGDREAQKQLVERHIGRTHTYLLHHLGEGQEDTIQKVVAATFSEALRSLGPYSDGTASTHMDLWLIRVAERNLARMHMAPSKEPLTPQSSVLDPQSDLSRLRAAMSSLPNRHKFVLSLSLFEQMPAGDMAYTLGVTPAGAMRRLRAALKRVGKALEKQEEAH
jgi:DNA-directed RNA polymerase specialized sigma24 family protein